MSGRDHSETCEQCGHQRGGLDNLECACDNNLCVLTAGARLHLSKYFSTAWGLEKAVAQLPKALKLMRKRASVATPLYHKEAPRFQINTSCNHVFYHMDHGSGRILTDKQRVQYSHAREISLDVKTLGCTYTLDAKGLSVAMLDGLPIDARKAVSARMALQSGILDQFYVMAAPYKKSASDKWTGREYSWERAAMLMAEDFYQHPPEWLIDKNGNPVLVTLCTARFAGLAVYS